ncbi:MAG: branched-chain amino acid transporter substrate-binding protein, partial [Acidimicrobiia bacterium]|nr:branched-chain amino acid transporter substrate-binding protein [Acidimicrobiia bacterium]
MSLLRRSSWLGPLFFAALIICLPLLGLNNYWQREMIQIAIYYLLASSLNVVLGYGGEFAVGQVAVMAAGAYTAAILFEHGYVDLVPAMLIAIAAGIVLSLATGIPSIRLSSWTLGLVSFFLVLLLPGVVNIFKSQTGGLDGIPGLLNPTFFGI